MKALTKTDGGVKILEVTPPNPAPGEVVVKVMCAGLCRTDIYLAQGKLNCDTPRILGHECAGVISRLGKDVEQDRLGERVAVFPWLGCGRCAYCLADAEKMQFLCPERRFLGQDIDGCFAEFVVVPQDRCLPLDESISFQAGSYLEPLVAALGVLRAPLRKAKDIAVMGKSRIATLTSVVLQELAKCEHQVLSGEKGEENAFDIVVETQATESSLEHAMRVLRPDGLLVLKSRPAESVAWPVRLQVEKEISTMAVSYGSLRMARMILKSKPHLFWDIWNTPVPLNEWQGPFEEARAGREQGKTFFLPHGK